MSGLFKKSLAVSAACAAVIVAGCGQAASELPLTTIEVSVAPAVAAAVQLTDDLPGRVVAFRTAQIRAQVGGIVQRRLFTEGAVVRAGQPLFQINAAPFRADLDTAAAASQRAEAVRARAEVQVERLRPLLDADAVSQQSYDDAAAALTQAEADVAAARATASRRRLDLGFATITAPIGGRVGAAAVTEGALVGTSDANPLATIQQIDQVYVDVRQPASRLSALRGAGAGNAPVQILDSDGKPTGLTGRLLFSEMDVDPGTGDVTVRVLVDNRSGQLLPGMFVRARLPRGAEQTIPRVPQQAVFRTGAQAQVMVVLADGTAVTRTVQVGDVIDNHYVVLSGLRAGERVIVEGRDRVMPNVAVTAVAWRPAVQAVTPASEAAR